jgi:uncharacterized repeat protein (TIGR01451 family)
MKLRHLIVSSSICLSLLFHCTSLFGQWQFVGSPETGLPLHYSYSSDKIYMIANAGLFVSADEGNSWNQIPLPDSISTVNHVHESNGSLYLFNINFGLREYAAGYRSDDNGLTWKSIYPFAFNPLGWKRNHLVQGDTIVIIDQDVPASSVNKGDTYTIHGHPPAQIHEIFFHKDKLMAVGWDKLYSSPDLGATWDVIYTSPPIPDSVIFFTVMSVDDILYKFDTNNPPLKGNFYRSDDDGVTWEKIFTFDQPFFDVPNISGDAGNLFMDEGKFGENSIYHSTNQGATWSLISSDPLINRFQYINDIFFRLDYDQSSAGVVLSQDVGETFQQYNTGFSAADCKEIISGDDKLWINANAKIFKHETGNAWGELTNYTNLITADGIHLMAYENNVLKRSDDGGEIWYTVPASSFNRPSYDDFGQIFACGNLFFVNIGPGGPNVYFSDDFGVTWDVFEGLEEFNNDTITAVSYDDTGYVVSGDLGTVIESIDGSTWEEITYDLWVGIEVDLSMLHRANGYTFAKVINKNVVLSPGSSTWEEFIVDDPYPIVFAPMEKIDALSHIGNVLIGSVFGHGVFISQDNAQSWQSFNLGLTDFQTRDVEVIDDVIYLAVNGGLWSRPISDLQLQSYTGIVYNDKNENALQDGDEEGFENIIVSKKASNNSITTEADGSFTLYSLEAQPDTIFATPPSYAYVTTPPIYVTGSTDQLAIGIHYIPGIYDGSIVITNSTPFRPGFETTITLTYKNKGTETADFEIKFALPEELEYLSAIPNASVLIDTLSWIINDLEPRQSGNVNVVVKTNVSVPIGTILSLFTNIEVIEEGDVDTSDNEAFLAAEVVGAYDPNDKAVFPAGYISPTMIGDTQRLEYTIRFQNTGNFPATFVRIQDTLSSNLDLTSLEILSASHDYTWNLLPGNVLDVYFENINLPDSTNDERGSHGFVKFTINAKTTLQLTDQIENKAYIYFDFNVPVITNTVGSTVGFETGIKEPGEKLKLTASPNPTKDFILITISDHVTDGEVFLSLYDTKGALVKTKTSISPENIQMDIQDLPSGVYYLHASIGHDHGTISILKN